MDTHVDRHIDYQMQMYFWPSKVQMKLIRGTTYREVQGRNQLSRMIRLSSSTSSREDGFGSPLESLHMRICIRRTAPPATIAESVAEYTSV